MGLVRKIIRLRSFNEILRIGWPGLVAVLLVGLVVSCLSIHMLEGRDLELSELYKTFQDLMPYLLAEFSDLDKFDQPASQKIVFVLFVLGVLILTGIIGKIASFYVKMEDKVPTTINHIIICNWNDRGEGVIREILSFVGRRTTEIVVIAKPETRSVGNLVQLKSTDKRVHFIPDDPSEESVLKKQNVSHARSVIILADAEEEHPDLKTIDIATAIRLVIKDEKPKQKPWIIAELTSTDKVKHLEEVGVNEWVCSTDYGLRIIAHCALKPKLTKVFTEILSYSTDTNEIYLVDSPECEGKTFEQVSRILGDIQDPENPIILLGVKRGDRTILNPKSKGVKKREKFETFNKDDSLIVMAYTQPSPGVLRRKMKANLCNHATRKST